MKLLKRVRNIFSNIKFCFRLLYNANKRIFVTLMIMNFFTTLAPIILLYITKDILNAIVDGIANSGDIAKIFVFIAIYFAFNIVSDFIRDFTLKISTIATQDLMKHINIGIMDKSTSLDIAYFDIPQMFNEINVSRNNAKSMHTIVFSLTSLFSALIQFISSLIIALSINGLLVLLCLAIAIPKYLLERKVQLSAYDFDKSQTNDTRKMNYIYSLFFRKESAEEMRYYNLTNYFLDIYIDKQRSITTKRNKFNNTNNLKKFLLIIPDIAAKIFINIFIILKIVKKIYSIGDFTYINGIYSSLSLSLDRILSGIAVLEGYDAKINDYKKYFSYNEKEDACGIDLYSNGGISELEFRNVTFRYPNSEKDTLKNLSFHIKNGEKVMLVGENGAGKSTIVKLICGFYTEYSGQILVNGIDIKEYDISTVRKCIASVFQDFSVYSFKMRENLAFGNIAELYNDVLLNKSLENAGFVDGYDLDKYINRDFEPDGIVLSGGQRQKVAIARAYVRNSKFVMMDEPNAALDPIAECDMLERFKNLYDNRMLIFISHRLSNASLMDNIIVLSDGTVVESGTHQNLMKECGQYYEMFIAQSEKYKRESV